ncbi:membrane dipeptidase [Falsiroseomonas sp.]|uniref:membrane dipeptidase n=1 Tax=Falsiroseomonas sp. TaxID=2870721 RepID=UPI003F72A9E3
MTGLAHENPEIMARANALHARAVVFDGLSTCNWSRTIFSEMAAGGVTAVNAASVLWEDLRGGLDNILAWRRMLEENADLLRPVKTVADIHAAKAEGRTGISIGWQNTSPIEDRLQDIGLFKDLGVGIMQLTYNTQNYSGAGYLELNDSGLTGFGREVVHEMNRAGVLCDLSHVGEKTAFDTIATSRQPVCISHVLPRALHDVARNKTDALLAACAARGGLIGVSLFSPGLARGNDSTVEDYIDAMAHVIALVGEDHVGLGCDFSLDHPRPGPYQVYASRDKGHARELTEYANAKISKPLGIRRIHEMPHITAAMVRRGWSEETILKLLGGNWLRLLERVWGG